MKNSDIQEIQEIQEIQNINPRSRTGRRRIIGKTTADGKPADTEYFKKNITKRKLNNRLIVMYAEV